MLNRRRIREIAFVVFVLERLRQSEIQHLHFAVRSDLDIGRLQIPMNDAFLVRRFQRFAICFAIPKRFIDRNRPALDAFGQRFSADEFHHQKLPSAGFFHSVNRRDVRMIQRRQHAGFTLESRRAVASCVKASGRSLMATLRPSFESVA